ncbi:Hypp4221 [Branchiostoma lanceolatum]|uniref:Hypp4221 protein n=1 Tax=Branchiostoma lanceolatum TaxID=7740 RepID=A0A8K0F0N2_BRALA|nr:Hypp4221 [Branchiostoma lanceolatum]
MSGVSVAQKTKRKTGAFSVAPRMDGATLSLPKGMKVSPVKALGSACYSLASRLVGKAWLDQRQLDREVSEITKGQAWLDTYIGAQFRPVQLAPRVVGYFPKHQVAHPQPMTKRFLHFSSEAQEDATVLPPNNDANVCGCCSEPDTNLQEDNSNSWEDGQLNLLFEEDGQDNESMVTSKYEIHNFLTEFESANKTQHNIDSDAATPQPPCPWC